MNPYEARLTSLDTSAVGRWGRAEIKGAIVRVRLDLVPDAVVGDTIVIDSGVAVAVVRRSDASRMSSHRESHSHVPGRSR